MLNLGEGDLFPMRTEAERRQEAKLKSTWTQTRRERNTQLVKLEKLLRR
jgi:hypothetical protein